MLDDNFQIEEVKEENTFALYLPVLVIVFFLFSYFINFSYQESFTHNDLFFEESSDDFSSSRFLSSKDLASVIKDTVYTDKDVWFELFIHRQMLRVHYRNGETEEYPVSSGSKYLQNGVETRPGLFSIFYKNPHHLSTQFNSASLYHFMAFNQGIGFHSMDGTGYYAMLGKQPSSRGCIRVAHAPARRLFEIADLGTFVLAHNGHSSRAVAFAPEGFKNQSEYSKEDHRVMLAKNLHNVLEGNYFTAKREFFVTDPSVIPVSGVYIGYDKQLPEKHKAPRVHYTFGVQRDNSNIPVYQIPVSESEVIIVEDGDDNINNNMIASGISDQKSNTKSKYEYSNIHDEMIVRKYFHNPIGILPYFGPGSSNNNRPRRVSTSASVQQQN